MTGPQPLQITLGDDMHLNCLMAPYGLTMVTGDDRKHLLAFGRAAFAAGKKVEADRAQRQAGQEPVMIYHGSCIIDCGEHGHQDVELLKLIPTGTKLYAVPQPDSRDAEIAALHEELRELTSVALAERTAAVAIHEAAQSVKDAEIAALKVVAAQVNTAASEITRLQANEHSLMGEIAALKADAAAVRAVLQDRQQELMADHGSVDPDTDSWEGPEWVNGIVEEIDTLLARMSAERPASHCTVPPDGWACSRQAGHTGPCAAMQAQGGEAVMSTMRHTYHYCAEHPDQLNTTTIDGILQCVEPITTMDRYSEIKRLIAVKQLSDAGSVLIIRSLSYLGPHPLP